MAKQKGQSASPADENQDVSDAATSTAKDDENLGSSPEQDEGDEESWESVIGEALKSEDDSSDDDGEDEDTESESEEGEGDDTEESEEETDEEDENADKGDESDTADKEKETDERDDGLDVEEGQKVPYQRFRKVIEQRNSWEEKAKAWEPEVKRIQAIDSYMQQQGLTPDEVSQGVQLVALINNDPVRALEQLQPIINGLHQYTGRILPQDLQQQVDRGELTEDGAAEIVRSRNEAERVRQQAQQRSVQDRQRQQAQAQSQVTQQIVSAVSQVESELSGKDPDFAKKLPHLKRAIQVELSRGRPQNPQEAEQLVRNSYQQVNRELAALSPRRATKPKPKSGETVRTGDLDREPESMLDAMNQALTRSRK